MLLTERLFYSQGNIAQPDGHRLKKVKKTMARIKVVLGERQRAFEKIRQTRGEAYPKQKPQYQKEVTLIKKFGRPLLVPIDHPYAISPTRAEKATANRKIRNWRAWKRRDERRKQSRKPVPEEAQAWAYRKPGEPLQLESVTEAAMSGYDDMTATSSRHDAQPDSLPTYEGEREARDVRSRKDEDDERNDR